MPNERWLNNPCCNSNWWGPDGAGPPRKRDDPLLLESYSFSLILIQSCCLQSFASVLLLANFLTGALASERGFYAFLLTGLQVKGVALDLFNNVFLLHFALEAAQGVLEGFPLLQSNFRQTD